MKRLVFLSLVCVAILSCGVFLISAHPVSAAASNNSTMFGYNSKNTRVNPFEQTINTSNVNSLVKDWSYLTSHMFHLLL